MSPFLRSHKTSGSELNRQAIDIAEVKGFGNLLLIASPLVAAAHLSSLSSPDRISTIGAAISTRENVWKCLVLEGFRAIIKTNGRAIFQRRERTTEFREDRQRYSCQATGKMEVMKLLRRR